MKTDHDAVAAGTAKADPEAAPESATEPVTKPATDEAEATADTPTDGKTSADEATSDGVAEVAATEALATEALATEAAVSTGVASADAATEDAATADAANETSGADAATADEAAAEPEAGRHAAPEVSTDPAAPDRTAPVGGLWPPRTTKARVLLAVALVLLVGLGAGGYWWFVKRLPEGVAFRVAGVEVTEQQLDEQVQTLGALYGIQAPTEHDRLDKFRRDVAKSTAVAMVIDNAAAERKIAVADRQVSDFLARYVTQFYGEGQAGRDAYIKDLASKSTSEPKVLAELKRQMTLKELFTQVTADITISDQDVRAAFDQRQADFGTPERREIHNIVVRTKQEADALVGEVNAPGANFEAIAGQRTADGSTKANGGNLGLVAARELQGGYANVAFAAPIGAVFGPVETTQQSESGPTTVFNVGKVVQAQPAAPADFEKVKDTVRRVVHSERADTQWRAYLADRIKDADVAYADDFRPDDPDSLPPIPDREQPGQQPAPAEGQPAPNAPPR